MPCYVTGSAEGDARLAEQEAQSRATDMARLLCEACGLLETYGYMSAVHTSKDLRNWWNQHKEIDEQRIFAENRVQQRLELQKQALSKLTTEERKALGL